MKTPCRKTFADNQRVKVAEAVRSCAEYRNNQYPIDIATGYFNLGGFMSIADVLESAPKVRILIGAEPEYTVAPDTLTDDRDDPKKAVARVQDAIVAGRDDLSFSSASDNDVERLRAFLARDSTEVRIYRERFLHGKAYIFGTEEAVIAGSANFTRAGLSYNLELDLGHYDPDKVRPVAEWFENLWLRAEPFDLAGIFDLRLQQFDPHQIYLRMLYAQYSPEFVADELSRDVFGSMQLADFQRIGSQRAIRILDEWNGAILADGVGLGKTVIAGDVIQTFTLDRGLRVLIVCPATLRKMWQTFLDRYNLPGRVLSYAELARDKQLSDGDRDHLTLPASQYRLIVADEAHALRNPNTGAYEAMVSLLAKSANAKLLLLTATPVNNSLWDLYWEVMLFAKTDNRFQKVGIPNLRGHIKDATKLDPDDLDPAHLFSVLDAISVRRTRRFVKDNFPNAKIGDMLIVFPEVSVHAVRYDLDAVIPGLFEEVGDAIEQRLHMARYQTQAYAHHPTGEANRQAFLSGLLRSQMLKRFESSTYAFRKTVLKMIESHEACLGLIEGKKLVPLRALDAEEIFDEDDLAVLEAEGDIADSIGFNTTQLCNDLREDILVLRELEQKISHLSANDDPKLQQLATILRESATDSNADKRKTLVFTSFVDTVDYIKAFLAEEALSDEALSGLVARSAYVLGNQQTDVDERAELASGFAPRSMKPDEPEAPDKYDLLVTTDVLAEGQNLQQCGRVINFDLPWNPMRVVQRNGRIDRIGSPHKTADIHCFMPDTQLDAILRLELRLQRKIAHANAGIGLEGTPIPGMTARERIFTDVAEAIASEKVGQIQRLAEGDASVIDELDRDDAYAGEQFREELRKALLSDAGTDLEKLPWGIGSGHNLGTDPGVVFLVRAGRKHFFRSAPLSSAGFPISADLLASLKMARCSPATPRVYPNEIRSAVYDAWERVRLSTFAWLQDQRDPAKRQGPLPKAQRDAIDLLERSNSDEAAYVADVLSVRWPSDIERDIREILKEAESTDQQRVGKIVEYVRNRGLKPQVLEEVPNVREDDIRLICYQVVLPR